MVGTALFQFLGNQAPGSRGSPALDIDETEMGRQDGYGGMDEKGQGA